MFLFNLAQGLRKCWLKWATKNCLKIFLEPVPGGMSSLIFVKQKIKRNSNKIVFFSFNISKTILPILETKTSTTTKFSKFSSYNCSLKYVQGRYLQILRKTNNFKASVNFESGNFATPAAKFVRFFGIELIKIFLIGSNVSIFKNRKKWEIPPPYPTCILYYTVESLL